MHQLLNFSMIVLLFVLVRAGDLAITHALTRDIIRAVAYGLVAILALIVLILTLA